MEGAARLVLLVVFVGGVAIGLLASIPTVIRQRREIGRLRKAAAKVTAASGSRRARRPSQPERTSMEFEFWWLLALPVFFGMGWVAARVDIKSLLSESRALPSTYFRGLNFLLKEQPDKAIESFLQVAKENPRRSSCSSRWEASFAAAARSTARSACTRTS